MDTADRIFLGKSEKPEYITLRLANRHGLVTGATGTGKTVSLQVLAEGFSNAGVPVFAADIKGDLSGVANAGTPKDFLIKRAEEVGLEGYANEAFPVVFWDLFGEKGHPVRTTVSEMGPLLLSRLLNLNDTQEGVLNIVFRVADEEGLLLLDLNDLQSLLTYVAEKAATLTTRYGNVSKATIGAIQRQLLILENQGGKKFFGEPALDIMNLLRTTRDGRGTINILAAETLMNSPRLYGTFLLWLLSELFEHLPEVGDPEKPKLVFFFDEAHLLFNEAPPALLEKIEQVVRLIRSKGVGVYFVTQNPLDVPDKVASQLGNRLQHALRAYTPREQKAVKAAAETFRQNPDFKTVEAITQLAVGEALVSTLEERGTPSIVTRTFIRPPSGQIGPITDAEREKIIQNSPFAGHYDTSVDRESAHEILARRAEETATAQQEAVQTEESGGGGIGGFLNSIFGLSRKRGQKLTASQNIARSVTRTITTQVTGQVANQVAKQIGGGRMTSNVTKAIVRGMLGGIMRK